ncbi:hypothetical protein [Streptomyces sp. Ac-502]|uniref:hypothetical protein n=1 Tax=Streptomyces sp. Ac-502 TaxID=3342801 RepID=UPI003862301C
MLPTMVTHGCPTEHHRVHVDNGVVVGEECVRCGYRITYEVAGRDRRFPPPRAPAADRGHDVFACLKEEALRRARQDGAGAGRRLRPPPRVGW